MKKLPAPGAVNEAQFLDEMNHVLAGWSNPAARLRDALQNDELQLYCQPNPGDFLPVFEHFRMMPNLDVCRGQLGKPA